MRVDVMVVEGWGNREEKAAVVIGQPCFNPAATKKKIYNLSVKNGEGDKEQVSQHNSAAKQRHAHFLTRSMEGISHSHSIIKDHNRVTEENERSPFTTSISTSSALTKYNENKHRADSVHRWQ